MMLLLDRSNAKELLDFVPAMKEDLPRWGMLDLTLTGNRYNIMHLGKKLDDALTGRDGVIYVHDQKQLLSFVRHTIPARECSAAFRVTVSEALPAGSCEIHSSEVTVRRLTELQERLIETNDNARAAIRSTLYQQRAARAEHTIMIADDNAEMCEMLAESLSRYGFCVAVSDPAVIVETYLERVPDILFLDINFPGMSGFEVIEMIRKYDKDAYIVMMTGASTASNAVSAKARGAKSFIGKPFDLPRLDQEVTRCPTMRRNR
jgi:CheY-like chemotaxis protein